MHQKKYGWLGTLIRRFLQLPGETVTAAKRQLSVGVEKRAPGRLTWPQSRMDFQGKG